MSKFGDLLSKNDKSTDETKEEKTNPFVALKKAVAGGSSPSTKATAADGELVDCPPINTPSAPFAFLGRKNVSPEVESSTKSSQEPEDTTSPDTTMQGISGDFLSEKQRAREFQSADQPDEYNKETVDKLKSSLDVLTNSIDNKELVGDALKKIIIDIKRHPFLADILHPEDCQLMVRALRENYGITIVKKQTRSAKKEATSKDVDEVMDMLGDMEISI